jgi:hypothetical protein
MSQHNSPLTGIADALLAVNPRATFGGVAPRPQPTHRIGLAGGLVGANVSPEQAVPLEHLFRTLPIPGVFTATPNNTVSVELGAFAVPSSMVFLLLDYRFDIYRPSGYAAGDFVPVEDRRLSTQVGWQLTSNGKQQGNWSYQLIPSVPSSNATSITYAPQPNPGIIPGQIPDAPVNQAVFNRLRAEANQASTGGLGMMPQRHHRDGLLKAPYSWALRANEVLQVKANIFEAVPIPVAFFEASITGWLLPQVVAEELLNQQKLPPMQGVQGNI